MVTVIKLDTTVSALMNSIFAISKFLSDYIYVIAYFERNVKQKVKKSAGSSLPKTERR